MKKLVPYEIIKMEEVNFDKICLHYTSIDNLNSIMEKGLEPRIGINSKMLEKNPKTFFTIGSNGSL